MKWEVTFLRSAFPDGREVVVDHGAEDDMVAGRFRCYGTHRGDFQRAPPPGKRHEEVDEV
jgi:hypothetical protein